MSFVTSPTLVEIDRPDPSSGFSCLLAALKQLSYPSQPTTHNLPPSHPFLFRALFQAHDLGSSRVYRYSCSGQVSEHNPIST